MSLSFNLPTPSEKAEMLQDNDKVGLFIARIAWGLAIVSFIIGIIALLGCKWARVASAIGWSLTGIALIIFSDTRGTFKYKKQEKDKMELKNRQMIINQRTSGIKELFKEWILKKYANKQITTNKSGIEQVEYDNMGDAHHIRHGETFEKIKLLTVYFKDLEQVYSKTEADKEIDQEVRERCFDLLVQEGILEAMEKYVKYTFINSGKHPDFFNKYDIKHRILK